VVVIFSELDPLLEDTSEAVLNNVRVIVSHLTLALFNIMSLPIVN
jgi:hypothetical protein